MPCPRWGSEHPVKHGRIHTGKAQRMCQGCRRQCVPDATQKVITPQTWALSDTLLLEKIPLAGIARVTGLSADDLQGYVNRQSETVPREVQVRAPQKVR